MMRQSPLLIIFIMTLSTICSSFSFKLLSNPRRISRLFNQALSTTTSTIKRSQQLGGARGILTERMEEALNTAFGENVVPITDNLVMPTQPVHGDYQCNIALTLTKKLSMKPKDIAEKIVKSMNVNDIVSFVNITGPGFISLKLSEQYVQSQLYSKLQDPNRLGITALKQPQRVIVDFSSPNIAKEMHVGHLRSTILGDSLSRILEFLGHDVLRLNHVGEYDNVCII